MTTLIVLVLWLFSGWVGYLFARYWVTSNHDFTRGDRLFYGAFILLGPINLFTATLFASTALPERPNSRSKEVLYPRRNR